jgi:hypothetical protein
LVPTEFERHLTIFCALLVTHAQGLREDEDVFGIDEQSPFEYGIPGRHPPSKKVKAGRTMWRFPERENPSSTRP